MFLTAVAMNLQRPSKRYILRKKGNNLAFSLFLCIFAGKLENYNIIYGRRN